jgi:eukaryotic-like serine/threonine-protein kinase
MKVRMNLCRLRSLDLTAHRSIPFDAELTRTAALVAVSVADDNQRPPKDTRTRRNVIANLDASTNDDARGFLQERLAYLGKVYALIGVSFCLIGNVADALSAPNFLSRRLADPSTWFVPTAVVLYLGQSVLCRTGQVHLSALRAIDTVTTISAATLHSSIIFATTIPHDLPGLSYARALLLLTFGFLIRAIVIPSSARRTLIVGLLATCPPVIASHFWYTTQTLTAVTAGMHALWTSLWCLGAVVIAALASHVIFEREVQLTSQLTHSNTVAIFDYGRTPDGIFYYAMEYLHGLNLEDLVRIDGPQAPGRIVHIMRQVASALTEAHGLGLIHRDIKPGNVILVAERGGTPDIAKVVDFGLVKELDKGARAVHEDTLAGTLHYLAPEIISSPDHVDAASDLYSLGCVGYYLLTGRTVFEGRTVAEVCSQHLYSEPVPPAEQIGLQVPETLSAIVMACLEKRPERRPASARALVGLLDGCHDVPRWTNEMGREWWARRGHDALARVRQQRERRST